MALWTTLPEDIKDSQHAHVVQVANGAQHALLLTDEGIVYSWGKNDHGELGRTGNDKQPSPITETIRDEIIVQIACGLNHCLVLSQSGALFAWGYNKAGQIGVEGFKSSATNPELAVRKPVRVKGFNGKEPSPIAKSISCGPVSSACVTTKGEVYVWGAISYYLFMGGKGYNHGENFTIPVKVRGIPDVCRPLAPRGDDVYVPDQIALYKDHFACTIAQKHIKEDLAETIKSLKQRSTQLAHLIKSVKAEDQAANHRSGDAEDESEELKNLNKDLSRRKQEIDEQISKIKREQARVKSELARIGRELTICDQQDTALQETTSALEVKKSEMIGARAANNETQVSSRAIDTQLNDIDYFKESNKRSRLQFFEHRDGLGREKLRLQEELTHAIQARQQVEGQEKLIQSLRRGDAPGASEAAGDDGLRIAVSKCMELAATDPQTLAGRGRFTGLGEVLAISERALQDVSSALKEVSAASSTGEGVLESVLEFNLKLRKECVEEVKQKLERAERGRASASASKSGRPAGGRSEESCKGMLEFFEEVSRHATMEPEAHTKKAAASQGFLGLPAMPSGAGGFFGGPSGTGGLFGGILGNQ